MIKYIIILCLLCAPVYAYANGSEMCIDTTFRFTGNDSVCIQTLKDADTGVICYLSQAKSGGITGSIGFAEDPSRFSLQCIAAHKITINDNFPTKTENLFSLSTSIFFKQTIITRFYDKHNNTLIYMANSKKMINGSPYNDISVIPLK